MIWDTECFDQRDRVFGLLSVVRNGSNFPVDYIESAERLALRVLQHFGGDLDFLE